MRRVALLIGCALAIFAIEYAVYAYDTAYMPWGRVDPIVSLGVISDNQSALFDLSHLKWDAQRPLCLVPLVLVTKLPFVGGQVWYFVKAVYLFMGALGLFLCLYELLDRNQLLFPLLVSLLYAVYPSGGWERLNQIVMASQCALGLSMLSYYFLLRGIRASGAGRKALFGLSLILSFLSFFMYEVSLVFSGALALFLLWRLGRKKLREGLGYAALLGAMPLLSFVFKYVVVTFQAQIERAVEVRTSISKATLLLDPAELASKFLEGFYVGAVKVWRPIMSTALGMDNALQVMVWAMAGLLLVTLVVRLLRMGRDMGRATQAKGFAGLAVAGIFLAALGYLPFLFAYHYPIHMPGRVHDFAAVGLSMAIVALIMCGTVEFRMLRHVVALAMVGLLVISGGRQYRDFNRALVHSWIPERNLWMDIIKQVPNVGKDTVVVMRGFPDELGLSPIARSFYSSLVLSGLMPGTAVKMIVLDRGFELKPSRGHVDLPSRMDLSLDGFPLRVQCVQGYYFEVLPRHDLRRPERVIRLPADRLVVFDYHSGKAVLHQQLSNPARIVEPPKDRCIFFQQFLGVPEVHREPGESWVRSGVDLTGFTEDGWVSDDGFTAWVSAAMIGTGATLWLHGDRPLYLPSDCGATAEILDADLAPVPLVARLQWSAAQYTLEVEFPGVVATDRDFLGIRIRFSSSFSFADFGASADPRRLVVRRPTLARMLPPR